MRVIRVTIVFAFLAVACSEAGFLSNLQKTKTKFTHLQATLPDPTRLIKNPSSISYWFNKIPQTQAEAEKDKWTQLVPGSDCTNGGKYNGNRFAPPTERSIAALYDSQGVVVGFQALYNSDKLEHGSDHSDCQTKDKYENTYNWGSQPMINLETIDNVQYKVLTAYFVDPETICSSTRDPKKVASEGFANKLYFQNGTTPAAATLIKAPAVRPDDGSDWENNKCLPLNGYHNFWHTKDWDNSNCNEVLPAWIFYDENKEMSGFGFTVPGCDDSPRFQHPPGAIVKYVSGSQCAERVSNTVKFSNINVYFVDALTTGDDCFDAFGLLKQIKKIFSFFG